MYLCIYIYVPLFHFFYSCWCNDQRYTIYDTQICRPTLTLTRSFKGGHVLGLFLGPRKLTWNIAVEVWKMIFPCKWVIFRFHAFTTVDWCIYIHVFRNTSFVDRILVQWGGFQGLLSTFETVWRGMGWYFVQEKLKQLAQHTSQKTNVIPKGRMNSRKGRWNRSLSFIKSTSSAPFLMRNHSETNNFLQKFLCTEIFAFAKDSKPGIKRDVAKDPPITLIHDPIC